MKKSIGIAMFYAVIMSVVLGGIGIKVKAEMAPPTPSPVIAEMAPPTIAAKPITLT